MDAETPRQGVQMPRVDYDLIAHLYDEPMRAHSADERLLAFLAERPDLDPDTIRILDVACGTGAQLIANRARLTGGLMVGVDRFRGMLRVARRREAGVCWVHGDGSTLPLASESFDYVTNQFSYHHIADPEAFVHEVARVSRRGARFAVTNIDPWSMPDWSIYQYFPEAYRQDLIDFLPADAFAALMREAGFVDVQIERRTLRRPQPLAEFLAYASDRHRTSQFITISDAAYVDGLARLQREVATADGASASVDSGVCLLTIVGDKGR